MKKSVIVIIAVAIIGAVGVLSKRGNNAQTLPQSPAASQAISSNTVSQAPETITDKSNNTSSTAGSYKDGTYDGEAEETEYGMVQVAAVISGGKITNIEFLQMPGPEGNSREITSFAEPSLKQSTLQAQSANIDFVSGATTTSNAYEQSLQAALDQAAAG